jgi:DnaJ-class molecular chaperone
MRLQWPIFIENDPFLFWEFLIYYQKIQLNFYEGDDKVKGQIAEKKECVYCSGKGYFQLLLGGSETCTCCGGSGKKQE